MSGNERKVPTNIAEADEQPQNLLRSSNFPVAVAPLCEVPVKRREEVAGLSTESEKAEERVASDRRDDYCSSTRGTYDKG